MTKFPLLFEPGQIGSLELPNRVVRASMSTSLGNADGTVPERALRFYGRLAGGGTGLVMSEYAYVDDLASKGAHGQFGISNDEHVAGLSRLAGAIHAHGVRAGIQIVHTGRQSETAAVPKAPSAIRWEHGAMPEELTVEEIDAIVQAFGAAARRAWLAGFDLVELHAAHGYLLTEFLSPHTNHRSDEYGGSFANRRRAVERSLAAVLAEVPDGFPVTVRVSCSDYRPDGIAVEETIELCRILEQQGAVAIHVSGGDHETGHMQWSPMPIEPAPHAGAARLIRGALAIPVILSGSIGTPERAERLLAEGAGDMIALARPLLADPNWTRKARAGHSLDIRPCIRCNDGCVKRSAELLRSTACTVNPFVENDLALGVSVATRRRNVAVVGGGPAGMVAGLILARRGHEVTLHERDRLGGRLHDATRDDYKGDLRLYLEYLVRQVEHSGIRTRPEQATAASLRAGDFDVVVLASGARRVTVGAGLRPGLHDALDLAPADAPDQRIAIVGGDYAAVESALRMASGGAARVILVAPGGALLTSSEQMERQSFEDRLARSGVEIRQDSELEEAAPDFVALTDERIDASIVAVSVTPIPETSLAGELTGDRPQVYVVGDAVAPGKVHDAVHSGYKVARRI